MHGSSPARGTLLYLHGGGYVACSPRTHRPITCALTQGGFRVLAPDYRLAPEHPFPAAFDDARAAYLQLLDQGIPASDITLAGDSAGGGLALALLISLRDSDTPLPSAAALFSPWTDLAATGPSLTENHHRCAIFYGDIIGPTARYYLGSADARNPLASPLYADHRALPPLLIHAGADEVLRDDSIRFAERARAAGVRVDLEIWPGVPHVWQLLPGLLPEAASPCAKPSASCSMRANSGASPYYAELATMRRVLIVLLLCLSLLMFAGVADLPRLSFEFVATLSVDPFTTNARIATPQFPRLRTAPARAPPACS